MSITENLWLGLEGDILAVRNLNGVKMMEELRRTGAISETHKGVTGALVALAGQNAELAKKLYDFQKMLHDAYDLIGMQAQMFQGMTYVLKQIAKKDHPELYKMIQEAEKRASAPRPDHTVAGVKIGTEEVTE